MKMKRFISAVAALTMSVSCFAGLTITANAADPVTKYTRATGNEGDADVWASTDIDAAEWVVGSGTWTVDAATGLKCITKNAVCDITKTISSVINDNDIVNITGSFTASGACGRAGNYDYVYFGDDVVLKGYTQDDKSAIKIGTQETDIGIKARSTVYNFDVTFDTAAGKITSFKVNNTEKLTAPVIASKPTYIKVGHSKAGGGDSSNWELPHVLSNITVKTTAQEVQSATYTVNYKLSDGTVVKTLTPTGVVGNEPTFSKDDFEVTTGTGDEAVTKTYFCGDDNSEGKTVAADNSTVVDITVREANTRSWVVTDSTTGVKVAEGTGLERASVDVDYSKYIVKDKKVYLKAMNGTSGFRYALKIPDGTGEYAATTEYGAYEAAADALDAVFVEIEDLAGDVIKTSTNRGMRASGYASGTIDDETEAVIATLPSGKYKMEYEMHFNTNNNNKRGATFKFQAEPTDKSSAKVELFSKTQKDSNADVVVNFGDEFTLTNESNIIFNIPERDKDSKPELDYVLFIKTGIPEPEESSVTTAPWQAFVKPTGQAEGKTFDQLTEGANLVTKTISVTVYDDTKPLLSINGETAADPGWTAYNDEANGKKIYYVQFMAADDDAFTEGFGTVKAVVGDTELPITLVEAASSGD